jgi:hypothetical protein
MKPGSSRHAVDRAELSEVLGAMEGELRCLLGPAIELATGSLPAGGSTAVYVSRDEIVDLLRHLALDAHGAMLAGGTIAMRTGRLAGVAECAAMVIHEVPDAPATMREAHLRKGRSLGLAASFDAIERVGGHFHVWCRGRETVLTICFPLAS